LSFGNADIYVCMSTQSKFTDKVSKKGKPYRAAIRLQENVVELKSLYLDVDVKDDPDKGYKTTELAMEAVTAFIAAAGLPQPTTAVASGSGGFHLHWVLDAPITQPIWQPLAQALVNATVAHGLKCDTQCTIDSARILRVPETFNQKHTPPKPTSLIFAGEQVTLEVMRAALAPYSGPAQKQNAPVGIFVPSNTVTGTNPELNAELGANLEPTKIPVEAVIEVCPFIANTIATGGADRNEPQWFAAATVANFLEDGLVMFHAMSDQHPDYTLEATSEKYQQAAGKQGFKNLGWPACQKIANSGSPECRTCPLLARGKSPLHFATGTADPVGIKPKVQQELHIPEPYTINHEGFIFVRSTDNEGNELLFKVMDYPIHSGKVSLEQPMFLRFTTSVADNAHMIIDVGGDVINVGKDKLLSLLGGRGITVHPSQAKHVQGFFMAWVKKLQSVKEATIAQVSYGWLMHGKTHEGFAYAGRVWMKNGSREAANTQGVLSRMYDPQGDLDIWKEAAKAITDQKRPALDVVLASAFAGPLVTFTGYPGLTVSAYSPKSGIGKTTSLEVAQAVWGNPLQAMNGLDDTPLSVIKKAGTLSSIPMFWDEIKTEKQVKNYCSTVFTLTGGKEKSRLNQDSSLRAMESWSTIILSASNESLMDGMAKEAGSTDAGFYRMFEYEVPPPNADWSLNVGKMRRLTSRLQQNYGQAGLIYAKWLGANVDRVRANLEALDSKLPAEVSLIREERLWISTIEVLLLGASYANALGLTEIDTKALKQFLYSVLQQNRSQIKGSNTDISDKTNALMVLAEFLNAMRGRHTLVTNRILITRGKPGKNVVQVVQDASRLEELIVHRGRDDGLVRIAATPLSKWLRERGHSSATWIKTMQEEHGMIIGASILGGGTDYKADQMRTFEIDMNTRAFAAMGRDFELPDEVTSEPPSALSANLDLGAGR
jgi:hypothetical protein